MTSIHGRRDDVRMKSLGYRTGDSMTRGEMGTRGTSRAERPRPRTRRRILKSKTFVKILGFPDGHVFVDDPSRALRLVRAMRRLKPRVILTHQVATRIRTTTTCTNSSANRPGSRACGVTMRNRVVEIVPVPRVAHNIFSRRVEPALSSMYRISSPIRWRGIRAHRYQFHDPDSASPKTR